MLRSLIILSAVVLILCPPAMGQITITSNDFQPAYGTILKYHHDVFMTENFYNTMAAGSGGAMNWDFSARAFDTGYATYIINPALTPAIANFPTGNLVMLTYTGPDSTWTIYKSVSDELTRLGGVSRDPMGQSIIKYHDIAPDWTFPTSYGDQWVSFRHWSDTSSEGHTDMYDTTYNNVDAWGTIQYQTRSFPCLRVLSHERITIYSFDNDNNPLGDIVTEFYILNFVSNGNNSMASLSKSVSILSNYYSGTVSAELLGITTDVQEVNTETLPSEFSLEQNYPNPFNPETEIRLNLRTSADVKLVIYDILGREVKVLIDRPMDAGSYIVDWDGTNQSGQQVSSGVYFYRMNTAGFSEARKMVLLR